MAPVVHQYVEFRGGSWEKSLVRSIKTSIAASSLLLLAALAADSPTLIRFAGSLLSAFSAAYIALIGLAFKR